MTTLDPVTRPRPRFVASLWPPARPARQERNWAAVGLTLLAYLAAHVFLAGRLPVALSFFVVQPLLWGGVALLAWLGWQAAEAPPAPLTRPVALMAVLAGATQIALWLLAGVWWGFGDSPYSQAWSGRLGNLLHAGVLLVGTECARYSLLVALGPRRPLLAVGLTALFFTLLSVPPAQWLAGGDLGALLRLVGERLLPGLAEHGLAGGLTLLGGPLAALLYRAPLSAFEWSAPVLPDLPWAVTAALGTLYPAAALVLVHQPATPPEGEASAAGPAPEWLAVAVTATALVWLNTGLLGVQPTLISGPSMVPTLRTGDVALVQMTAPETIRVGDIIRFRSGEAAIVHRVVAIQPDGQGGVFVTRGDANNADDPPIPADALDGRVILVVPRLGWIGIGVRQVVAWCLALLT